MKRDAIGFVAGREAVFEAVSLGPLLRILRPRHSAIHGQRWNLQLRRKSLGIKPKPANHHIIQRPAKRGLLGRPRLAIPRVERTAAGDLFGDLAFKESDEIVFVPDQALAPLLRLDAEGFLEHALVGAHKIRPAVDIAAGQRLAQEDRVRQRQILPLKRHRPLLDQHQPEQADLFVRHHAAALLRPVRVAAAGAQQMRCLLLDPQRFDARIHHAPHATAHIQDLRGKNPGGRHFRQRGTRKNVKLSFARAAIHALVVLVADLRRQPRKQAAMHRFE